MMSKALPLRLSEVLKQVRKAHPLPGEHFSGDSLKLNDLIIPLKKLDGGEWNRFCRQLNPYLERLIFQAIEQVSDRDGQKRLLQLCRERCSWSLYEQGWHAFQEKFPNRSIQLAFAEIYATLRRNPKRYGPAPSYIRDFLPARVDFSLAPEQLLHNSFVIFNEHMQDNKDELAMSSLNDEQNPYQAVMRRFYKNYGLIYTTYFGAALLGKYLLSCDDLILFEQRRLIGDIISMIPTDQFLTLLNRVCQSPKYSAEQRDPLLSIIFHALEQNPNGQDLWLQMPRRTRQTLLRWHIWSVMQEHYAMNPRKESIMLHFSRSILDVIELDSHTVAWRFRNFTILDSWLDMDYSYYYPQAMFDEYFKHRKTGRSFIDSDIRYRVLSEDNFKIASTAAVRLGFIVPHLEHTVDFLARMSGQKSPSLPKY